ncbi:MAG: DUF4020 domain-containing protein [Chloroflexi bacterium]|nr:DUF4020 domain-containing protein [Chloroflexota bacterium]
MRIADIDFPREVMDALRDNTLAVFAGAGVSKGEPARLPDFKQLACEIASGTGVESQKGETEDRFLGRLQQENRTDVHALAAKALTRDGLKPNALHFNLLRLFTRDQSVRLVTTNFDELFEQAAEIEDMFDTKPEQFRAPALPLGDDFSGIVHVHGAVSCPHNMVLTDKDFGKAYLTEGWARRFLVSLFREYTVLFVGYSHRDTDMHYLARALPVNEAKRYALIGDEVGNESEKFQRWKTLGIEPILYPIPTKNDHGALDLGIERLANHVRLGILGWQRLIKDIAQQPPPRGREEADVIEEALRDEVKTRFFAEHATSPEWIEWLDERSYLDSLFEFGELNGIEGILSWWLSSQFACQHPDRLFLLIGRHNLRLHPNLWWKTGHHVSKSEAEINETALSRWISVLIADIPQDTNSHHILSSLARLCAQQGLLKSLIQLFDAMTASRLTLKQGYDLENDEKTPIRAGLRFTGATYALRGLWEDSLRPTIDQVVESVISIATKRLEERDSVLRIWGTSENWERPAIEEHEQNRSTGLSTILVNIARDSLEWLAENRASAATRWRNCLATSDAPILRRLALNTICAQREPASHEKIEWLLTNVNIHDHEIHHEVFRLAAHAYPNANKRTKRALVSAILEFRWEGKQDTTLTPRQIEARHKLDWFHWLISNDLDCPIAKQARDETSRLLPEFRPREHPDFLIYSELSLGPRSPWTVEELLDRPAATWREELLAFDPSEHYMLNRNGLLSVLTEAAKQSFDWGFELAESLAQSGNLETDLWTSLLNAWMAMDLDEEQYRSVISCLANSGIDAKYAYEIANVLFSLVQNRGKPYALKLLSVANSIASALWQDLKWEETDQHLDDWFERAHEHTAGRLTEFWLHGLSVWHNAQESTPEFMIDEYRVLLSTVVNDSTLPGKLSISVLASEFAFLLTVDRAWTLENLLPSFDPDSKNWEVAREALARIIPNPSVAELLEEAFLEAVQWFSTKGEYLRDQFIERYIYMIAYFVEDPLNTWIPKLFNDGGADIGEVFTSNLNENYLWEMDEATQREWWHRWLKDYWENRLEGVPYALTPKEVAQMLHWPAQLTAVFPEAVALAMRMGENTSEFGNLLYSLQKGNLPQRFPNELARFLLHLDKIGVQDHWWGAKDLLKNLLESSISNDTKHNLRELMARQGLEE